MKHEPVLLDDQRVNQAIRELNGHKSFQDFKSALYSLRETALSRLWDDTVISNERVCLAYQVEARVYQDILNRIQDAGVVLEVAEDT